MTGVGLTTATAPPALTPATLPAKGAFAGFGAELLLIPTGLVTIAVLSRELGPAAYGMFALLVSLISWLCWLSTSILARTAVRVVSEADDWQSVAAMVLRWRVLLGGALFLRSCCVCS